MTPERLVLLEISYMVGQLPEAEQTQIRDFAEIFRKILKDNSGHATMAFALVGAEQAAKE